jgi:hypothetical protein
MTGENEHSAALGDEEEYRGPATLRIGDEVSTVEVRLSARFEPVEGRFRWAGRTAPDEELLAKVRGGAREATLIIGEGAGVPARLGDPDPWGGIRLTGAGRPPW